MLIAPQKPHKNLRKLKFYIRHVAHRLVPGNFQLEIAIIMAINVLSRAFTIHT